MKKEEKKILYNIRTGQRSIGRVLKNDPLAIEKLTAKRDALIEERNFKKIANRNARMKKEKPKYKPSTIADLTSRICKINDRINLLKSEKNKKS